MIRKTVFMSMVFAASFALSSAYDIGSVQAQRFDCVHGPDTYRVRGVADWDVLNIRSGPSSRRRIVGEIPPYGSGVHCLGPCRGNWCRISWRGVIGWVHMRHLGE